MNQVTREEFQTLIARQDGADAEMHEIRHDITQIKSDTGEVVEMFRALSGGLKVLQGLGKIARPITYIAAMIGACIGAYTAWKNGFGR